MKFYRDINNYSFWNKIINNNLTAVYCRDNIIIFFKNGKQFNSKNAAYIDNDNGYKQFHLNNKLYGNNRDFTKESWRRFVKLQAFI
jgi:hypothetical protein